MNKTLSYALCALFLATAACGDDGTGTTDNNSENNVAVMDMGNNQTDDMGESPVDMGESPVDMGEQPEDMGGTADAGGEEDMGTDMAMEVDMGQPYEWPATPADFISSAERVSYIAQFGVPEVVDGSPVCCRDFGANSKNAGIDNAFSSLNAQLSGIPNSGIDFQAALTAAIQDGSLVFLLDHRELDGADDADGFLLSWLTGSFAAGSNFADASVGLGTFDVAPSSFVGNTGEPVRVMDPAEMTASMMSGGPISIDVILPFGAASIPVPIDQMNASATATIATDSVTYTMGEMSGYIPEDEVFAGINSIASSPTCTCLGLNGADLYNEDAMGRWSGTCQDVSNKCLTSDEFPCRVIAGTSIFDGQVCTVLPGILTNAADIDTNNDGDYDALSIGLTWEGVDATIQ